MDHENQLTLPISIVSPSDLKRVKRELEAVNELLLQMEIRQGGETQMKLPKISKHTEDVTELNKANLLVKEDREHLIAKVSHLVDSAPIIHMSFSSEPSNKFLNRLMQYLREQFDPYILVTVGLAPSIGAGCIVRTTNRFFDLSLRQNLVHHRQELIEILNKKAEISNPAAEKVGV